jgi:hypothetical protein
MVRHIEHWNGFHLDNLDGPLLSAIFNCHLHCLSFQAMFDNFLGTAIRDFDNVNLAGDLRSCQQAFLSQGRQS